jgi:DNA mismatch repair protein MutL
MKIQILSEATVNKIATGEVIDRPLSAVKELVENSIDANATDISIRLERGGRTLISVSDNGTGIDKDNLRLAITPHATSKLPDEDITNIRYMGFRGEALAAIATAGRLKISSKIENSADAWMIEGNDFEIKPTSHGKGTTVDICDLFCFIPNRIRFLKPESSEVLACKNLIGAFALAHPNIKFQLIHNNKEIFNCRGNILDEILGDDFAGNAIEFDSGDYYKDISLIRLKGSLSIPTYNRTSNNKIFTFVNKRFVRDNFLNKLIKQAYFNTLPNGIFPSVVLFIELPPQCIDVNIHPNKSEVRFSDERLVRDIVINSIRDTIGRKKSNSNKYDTINKNVVAAKLPLQLKLEDVETNNGEIRETTISSGEKHLGRAILQIADKYILAQKGDNLVIVDQHGSHERIVLETINKSNFQIQNFLFPIEYDFGKGANEVIISLSHELIKIGIKVEFNNKIFIYSVPALPGNIDIVALLKDIVENHLLWQEIFKNHLDQILKKVACYSSIRAGRKLNLEEMNRLLRLIETTDFSQQCIHGRPTYFELDIATIDKLFERI